jgi:hypothetical protein
VWRRDSGWLIVFAVMRSRNSAATLACASFVQDWSAKPQAVGEAERRERGGHFLHFMGLVAPLRSRWPPTTFANRYDANFLNEKFLSQREIIPNRFALTGVDLLILSVL